jgi:hypothetical protein
MARKQFTAEGRVWFVPSLASTSAPSAASITAGTDLTPYLRRDGLATPNSGSTIDIADAASQFNKTAPGNRGGDALTLNLYRDSVTADDDAWAALPELTAGYIVVRRFGGSTVAAAATQKCEVYKGTVISREMQQIGDNDPQRFNVMFSVEEAPEMNATMAA